MVSFFCLYGVVSSETNNISPGYTIGNKTKNRSIIVFMNKSRCFRLWQL